MCKKKHVGCGTQALWTNCKIENVTKTTLLFVEDRHFDACSSLTLSVLTVRVL